MSYFPINKSMFIYIYIYNSVCVNRKLIIFYRLILIENADDTYMSSLNKNTDVKDNNLLRYLPIMFRIDMFL